MRHGKGIVTVCVLGLLVLGCQPAGRYGGHPVRVTRPESTGKATPAPEVKKVEPLPGDYLWMEPRPADMEAPVPIVFLHEGTSRAEWAKLKDFWTEVPSPAEQAAALLTASPFHAAALAGLSQRSIRIKVPLGLDDPAAYWPPANPPTLGKWELGKQLFYDKETFLQPASAPRTFACATCHDPAKGYTDRMPMASGSNRNAPTLINSVYNTFLFWDGRASALEEVVQRSLEDEREAPNTDPLKQHSWNGVVQRLRNNADYVRRFKKVFGTPPTQDAIGKALATYMRTILVGNSLHDQAERAMKDRGGKALETRDYEKFLDDALIKALVAPEEPRAKAEVAKELLHGHELFSARGKGKCVQCHGGANFTDNGFHNVSVGDSNITKEPEPGTEPGRFAVLPPGLKERRLIGAYKTPTLRGLPRTAPYFHNGSGFGEQALFFVVLQHVRKGNSTNLYLDPDLRGAPVLNEEEMRALLLFLNALDGDSIPSVLREK